MEQRRKIFFIMRHQGYIRNYESAIVELDRRGFDILLGFIPLLNKTVDDVKINELTAKCPHVSWKMLPLPSETFWSGVSNGCRRLLDYLRYLHPRYRNASKLRARVQKNLPPIAALLFDAIPLLRRGVIRRAIETVLRAVERAIPANGEISNLLRAESPDLVLLTPIADSGSNLLEYLKSSLRLGIRTGLCVASWDNLSNKGLVQIEPDRVFVWNDIQKQEASELHAIDPQKVAVTGAQLFDRWFACKPSVAMEEFCRKASIRPDRPFILYVCSSIFIARHEVAFIREWIERLRSSNDPAIREMGILIRPHPNNVKQWIKERFPPYENVSRWPPFGASTMFEHEKDDYYDSIFYSSAVVGINTSAMIEAGIVGKPVHTITHPDFRDTQEGTIHFHYLVKGGLLYVGEGFEDHLRHLRDSLIESEERRRTRTDFVAHFVRPRGIDKEATPFFVDAVERFAEEKPSAPRETSPLEWTIRLMMLPFGLAVQLIATAKRRKDEPDGSQGGGEESPKAVGEDMPVVVGVARRSGKKIKKKKKTSLFGNDR